MEYHRLGNEIDILKKTVNQEEYVNKELALLNNKLQNEQERLRTQHNAAQIERVFDKVDPVYR